MLCGVVMNKIKNSWSVEKIKKKHSKQETYTHLCIVVKGAAAGEWTGTEGGNEE